MKTIKKYWEGNYPLVQSFWIGALLLPIVLLIPLLPTLYSDASSMSTLHILFSIVYWIFLFVANLFLIIGAFKSASKHVAKNKKKGTFWGRTAQVVLVFSGISVVVQFLQQII
jgi:hypothetical protein|tara:strand:+ start:405 stop:743 length:339 start_codon:yes stop_codon:yes gene_type:complete